MTDTTTTNTFPAQAAPWGLREALEHVRSTLRLRHIDQATDDEVAEALEIADRAIAGTSE